jgi:hypothetical protein
LQLLSDVLGGDLLSALGALNQIALPRRQFGERIQLVRCVERGAGNVG